MNKTRLLAFLWIFILFLIQNGLQFVTFGKWPLLILIGVIFYALLEGPLFGLVIGGFAGFLMDLSGTGRFGLEMMIFGSLGVLAGLTASKIFRESLMTQLLLPALGNYFVSFINLAILLVLSREDKSVFWLMQEAFLLRDLFFIALASPVVFWILKKVSLIQRERSSIWRMG